MTWIDHQPTVAGYNTRLERVFRLEGDAKLYGLRVENYRLREKIRQLEIQVRVLQTNLDSIVEPEEDAREETKEI